MNPVTASHSTQLACKNVDKIIKTRQNPDLPLELILRILGEAGQPLDLLFKDQRVGSLKAIYSKAYWSEIAKKTVIPISQKSAFSEHEAVKQAIVSYCKKLTDNHLIDVPKEIHRIVKKEALTSIDLRRLAEWKEARDNVVILRMLKTEERKNPEDLDYKWTVSKGTGKAFDDAFDDWKKKKLVSFEIMLSFCGLNTLPKQFIAYLVTSDEHTLFLNHNNFEYLQDSFALLARSGLKWISFIGNNLQVLPSWMEDFKELRTLDLRGNPALSKKSIEELQKKLPNCKISYNL